MKTIEQLSEIDLGNTWEVIMRRKGIMICFFAACVFSTVAGTFIMTPIYRATAIVVIKGESSTLDAQASDAAKGMNIQLFEGYMQTQVSLIKSRSVAGKVFDDLKLASAKRYQHKRNAYQAFLKDIDVDRVRKTGVVSISMNHPRPELAADIANRLAESYAKNNLERRTLEFIQNQRTAFFNEAYLRFQSELALLSNKYGPKHPKMIALRNEINAISKRGGETMFDQPVVVDMDNAFPERTSLSEELAKIQAGSVMASSRMNNIVIRDRAKAPIKIFKPNRNLNIFLGILIGLFGGFSLAFLIDRFDDTIKSEEDIKDHIENMPFLGAIPLAGVAKGYKQQVSKIDRFTAMKPDSAFSEASRLIRTEVLWLTDQGNTFNDMAVISPQESEGKTTVSSNLLRQYLDSEMRLDDVVDKTNIDNLFVVCCGKGSADPTRLLSSAKMSEFIEQARTRYDFIIYDTAPLTYVADTAILITKIKAVVLNFRIGLSKYRSIPKALELIKGSAAHLIGITLDGIKADKSHCYSKIKDNAA